METEPPSFSLKEKIEKGQARKKTSGKKEKEPKKQKTK